MRNSIVHILFLIILSGLSSGALYAQSDYLVLAKGDTLYGKVTHLNFGTSQQIQLVDESKKKTVYPITAVKSFKNNDGIFHLIRIYTAYKYMKLIQPGYLSYYMFQQDNQVTWDGRFLYKIDGDGIEIPNIGFKKKMADFLVDCPETVDQNNSGDLNRNNIEDILIDYNACIEKRTTARSETSKPIPQHDVRAWESFESAIKDTENLADKETLLEMVTEVKAKAERGEKIPNFLLEGVKKVIEGNASLEELLTKALSDSEKKKE